MYSNCSNQSVLYLSICNIYLSVYLSACLSTLLVYLSICISFCVSVHLSTCPSIYLSIYLEKKDIPTPIENATAPPTASSCVCVCVRFVFHCVFAWRTGTPGAPVSIRRGRIPGMDPGRPHVLTCAWLHSSSILLTVC